MLTNSAAVALVDFEQMRKRTTLAEDSQQLKQSSWHEQIRKFDSRRSMKEPETPMSTIHRLSATIRRASMSKDDPEKFHRKSGLESIKEVSTNATSSTLFGAAAPACAN